MQNENKPVIKTVPNGPFRFMNIPFITVGKEKKRVDLPLKRVDICRCGASKSLPFCDGRHGSIGFSSEPDPGASKSEDKSYRGKGITVHFDLSVCAHVGICVRDLPEVFDIKKRPWIDPDGADVGRVIALIRRCPSGALSYTVDGVRVDSFESDVAVEMFRHGPINVYGGIELQDEREPKVKDHYSLCHCGKSAHKPFCDGAHLGKRFERVCSVKEEDEGSSCSL